MAHCAGCCGRELVRGHGGAITTAIFECPGLPDSAEVEALKSEVDGLMDQLCESETVATERGQSRDRLVIEMTALRSQVDAAEAAEKSAIADFQGAMAEVTALRAEVKNYTSANAVLKQLLNSRIEEVGELQAQLITAERTIERMGRVVEAAGTYIWYQDNGRGEDDQSEQFQWRMKLKDALAAMKEGT